MPLDVVQCVPGDGILRTGPGLSSGPHGGALHGGADEVHLYAGTGIPVSELYNLDQVHLYAGTGIPVSELYNSDQVHLYAGTGTPASELYNSDQVHLYAGTGTQVNKLYNLGVWRTPACPCVT